MLAGRPQHKENFLVALILQTALLTVQLVRNQLCGFFKINIAAGQVDWAVLLKMVVKMVDLIHT